MPIHAASYVSRQCISQQETDFEWRREGISKAGKTIAGNRHCHVSLYRYVYKIFSNQKRESICGLQPLDQQFIMNHFGWAELAFNHFKTYAEVMGSTIMHSQIALALYGSQVFQQSQTPTLHKLFIVGHEDGNAIVI